MNTAEKSAFVSIFVRIKGKNDRIIRVRQLSEDGGNYNNSPFYHKADILEIEKLIEPHYLEEWERFLLVQKQEAKYVGNTFGSYLIELKSYQIDREEFRKYDLPEDYIFISQTGYLKYGPAK